MERVHREHAVLLDPHTAVGVLGLEEVRRTRGGAPVWSWPQPIPRSFLGRSSGPPAGPRPLARIGPARGAPRRRATRSGRGRKRPCGWDRIPRPFGRSSAKWRALLPDRKVAPKLSGLRFPSPSITRGSNMRSARG
jgi:hypothetical protein